MKRLLSLLATGFLATTQVAIANETEIGDGVVRPAAVSPFAPSIRVAFSPGEAEAEVFDLVRKANKSIRILTTSLVNRDLADELLLAKSRGVDVRVLFSGANKDQKSFVIAFLKNAGVFAAYASTRQTLNSNFIVTDESNSLAGSVDYASTSFRRNYETIMIVKNHPDAAFKLMSAWDALAAEAEDPASVRQKQGAPG